MNVSRIAVVVSTIACVIIAVWVWQSGTVKTQSAENVPVTSTEERFIIDFKPAGFKKVVGSITLLKTKDGYVVPFRDRPGDKVMMSFAPSAALTSDVGNVSGSFGIGEGSEVRFYGTFKTTHGSITGEKNGGRLVFRKADGTWAYVSGLGYYDVQDNVTRLGYDRTVETALSLLKSKDPILQEGGARDLGRLWTASYEGRQIVPKLAAMLTGQSVPIKRGAIEGLGLIGTADATIALQEAYAKEVDEVTREFFEEALGFCAAYSILGEPFASAEPSDVGLDRLVKRKKLSNWVINNIYRRITTHPVKALKGLEKAITSGKPKAEKAAGLIAKALLPLLLPQNDKTPE